MAAQQADHSLYIFIEGRPLIQQLDPLVFLEDQSLSCSWLDRNGIIIGKQLDRLMRFIDIMILPCSFQQCSMFHFNTWIALDPTKKTYHMPSSRADHTLTIEVRRRNGEFPVACFWSGWVTCFRELFQVRCLKLDP